MRELFVDTGYWIALLYPKDSLHRKAQSLHRSITVHVHHLITSEMVLTEFVNFFCESGGNARRRVVTFVNQIQANSNVLVIPQATELFDRALTFYAQRQDKKWSLTDCSSFLLMQDLRITEALAHDKHFEQAGFRILLTDETV